MPQIMLASVTFVYYKFNYFYPHIKIELLKFMIYNKSVIKIATSGLHVYLTNTGLRVAYTL